MRPLDPLGVPLSGTQLVEASAGTGKTHTLTTLYLRLLLERRLRPEQILVVTFTNAATAELKDRIRARLRAAVLAFEGKASAEPELARLRERSADRRADAALLREALRGMDEAAVFTIHGFCQRVLAEHAFESGVPFDLELISEQQPLLLEVVQDFWTGELEPCSDAEIHHLLDAGGGFSGMLSLASVALRWPDTPVVPEPEPVRAAPALAEYLALRQRVAWAWPECRAEVERRLARAPLHRSYYGPEALGRMLAAVDALCARTDGSLVGYGNDCARLTSRSLARWTGRNQQPPAHPLFELMDLLDAAHGRAARALEQWLLGLRQRLVSFVRSEMPARKAERRVQSFDDLLHQLAGALAAPTGAELRRRLRERHAVALVDEFQDTDPVQYRIFRSVFGGSDSTLFLIGDPKQAIYSFRGADVFAYLAAARDAGDRAWTLGTNWRSDPALVAATNTLFSRSSAPFVLPEIAYHAVQARPGASDQALVASEPRAPLEIAFISRVLTGSSKPIPKHWGEANLPRLVAAHVSRLLGSGARLDGRPVAPGDVAILTRTNQQARDVQLELRSLSIPSVMHGDASVLDSDEARELARVLDALVEPTHAAAVRAALATTLLGLSAEEIDRLRDDESAWERWMDGFSRWHATWQRQGFVQAFRLLMREERMASRLLALVDGDRRLTNVLHLVELLHQEASRRRLGMAGVLSWFSDVRFDRRKREALASDAQQIRLERDDRAVQLTTMHRSKGLEYPIVYCPFLWSEGGLSPGDKRLLRYHDPDDELRFKIDMGPTRDKEAAIELAELEARSESMRLAYVALTRARHRTVVFWGAFRQSSSPLARLLHPPELGGDERAAGQRLAAFDDRRLRADLGRLLQASAETIEVSEVDGAPGVVYRHAPRDIAELRARSLSRELGRVWRASSFSALAATGADLSVPAAEGHDRDERSAEALPPRVEHDAARRVTLHAFPRGARAGDLVHSVLEHLDFAADTAAIEQAARAALDRQGFDVERWCELLAQGIREVLETPLWSGSDAPRLRDVPAARRLSELQFVLPVHEGGAGGLTGADLARVIERQRPESIDREYIARLARLGFEPLAGYLRGFIDLVFEHGGRFYVADYKSNHLGVHPEDYRGERIAEAMAHHNYHLQYLIYSVAVHRHLGARLPGYDFDRHFGGAVYLFLRGMHPESGPGRGVFFTRPSRRLIEELSEALGGAR